MVVDVSSILKEIGGKIEISGEVFVTEEEFSGVKFTSPAKLSGNITNNGETLILSAHLNCHASTVCARCLKDIEIVLDFDISEMLAQNNKKYNGEDDIYIFENESVDLTEIIVNNLLSNISGRYLCSEDCKGLCPKCGADLNISECGCDTEVTDPRWAVLTDIMKSSSEKSD